MANPIPPPTEESASAPDRAAQSAGQVAFEHASQALFVVSAEGRIHTANASAGRLVRDSRSALIGRAIWDVVGDIASADDATWFRRTITQSFTGDRHKQSLEYLLDQRHPECMSKWTLHPVTGIAGNAVTVVVEARDVTDEQRERAESRLLTDLALALGHADSLETGLTTALETMCTLAGWSLGEAWLPSPAGIGDIRLVRTAVWAGPDRRLQLFVAQGGGFRFGSGEGLLGTAWQRREPVWDSPLGANDQFTRASLAAQAGLRAAVAFPIMDCGEPVAVVSCYMTGLRAQHARDVETASAVAAKLGRLLRQKQAEDAHRNADAQAASTIAISMDAIISIDDDRRISLFNWGAERIFGYTAAEVFSQSLDILLPEHVRVRHAADIAGFATSAQTSRRMGERSAIVGRRKSGEIFPAEASISRYMAGGHWTFTVMLRDITDRRRIEDGLRFLAEVGALLADLLHDQAVLQRAAERAIPMLADTCVIELVEGDHVLTAAVAAHNPEIARAIQDLHDRGSVSLDRHSPVTDAMQDRATVLLADGIEGWAGVTERPDYVRDMSALGVGSLLVVPLVAHERTLGAITFGMLAGGRRHDDSYRALAEGFAVRVALAVDNAVLYQRTREAVGARDEALAVVSHDLRNPLSAIGMYMSALREAPPPSPEATAELVDLVQESTALMSRIIQDLLDVASIDAGRLSLERRRQPLQPILERVEAMFWGVANERGIALVMERGGFEPIAAVEVDAERILQVLGNLLHNAIKFTEAGGIVHMRAATTEECVRVAVSDTGPGISPDEVPHIFDRFWHGRRRTKIRSTGLGLAIARGIVQAHGGRIWAESEVGRGSTFTFELPVSDVTESS